MEYFGVLGVILEADNTRRLLSKIYTYLTILTSIQDSESTKFNINNLGKLILDITSSIFQKSNKIPKIFKFIMFVRNWQCIYKLLLTEVCLFSEKELYKDYVKFLIKMKTEEEITQITISIKDLKSLFLNISYDVVNMPNIDNLFEIEFIFRSAEETELIANDLKILNIIKTTNEYEKFNINETLPLEIEFEISNIFKELEILKNLILTNYEICKALRINYFSGSTIASLSFKLWRKTISTNKHKPIKSINNWFIEDFIRRSYRGAITYVHEPLHIKNIYSYDIKSEYPKVMLKRYPVGEPEAIDFTKFIDINMLFEYINKRKLVGFVEAKITYNNALKVPFLKTIENINLYNEMPIPITNLQEKLTVKIPKKGDTWTDIYTTVELEYAYKNLNSYTIQPIKGYLYNTSASVFKEFVKKLFPSKESKHGYEKAFYKLLLNTLSGKLGTSTNIITYYVTPKLNIYKLNSNKVSYIHLASLIVAYARIYTYKIINSELQKDNILYYCNTDSFYFQNPIDSKLLFKNKKAYIQRLGKLNPEIKPQNEASF